MGKNSSDVRDTQETFLLVERKGKRRMAVLLVGIVFVWERVNFSEEAVPVKHMMTVESGSPKGFAYTAIRGANRIERREHTSGCKYQRSGCSTGFSRRCSI